MNIVVTEEVSKVIVVNEVQPKVVTVNQGLPGLSSITPLTETTISGLLKGSSGLVSGAVAGTDYEAPISTGTTSQYWRGDKSWQTLDKSAVGLSNVDNTSDANKPISTDTQTALNLKYDSSNPAGYVNSSGAAAASPVQSVNSYTGAVVLTKSDIGLSNVDNTSDISKPVSVAQNENSIINALIFG